MNSKDCAQCISVLIFYSSVAVLDQFAIQTSVVATVALSKASMMSTLGFFVSVAAAECSLVYWSLSLAKYCRLHGSIYGLVLGWAGAGDGTPKIAHVSLLAHCISNAL